MDDSPDTRANLLAALARESRAHCLQPGRRPGPHLSPQVSPDGEVIGLGKAYGDVSFYDTETQEKLGELRSRSTIWKWEYRPDGRQLAFTVQNDLIGAVELAEPSVRLVDATTFEEEPVQLGGLPEQAWPFRPHYSADGRFLAVGFEGFDGEDGAAPGVTSALVWDLASPAQPVLRLDVPGYDVELNADGSVLYVGALFPPPTVTAYEIASG